MIEIIPSFLVQSEKEFTKKYTALKDSVDMIQVDIADGLFVPNTTWANPDVIKKIVNLDIELHLMVSDPLEELKKWQTVEQVKRIFVHYESTDLAEIMPTLHAYGWDIGIVLNPQTKSSVLEPFIDEIKAVMFMGVVPGKQGQPFIPEVLDKIKLFRLQHPEIFISIDGAVNNTTLPDIVETGVNAICPGRAIIGKGSPEKNVQAMQKCIHTLTDNQVN